MSDADLSALMQICRASLDEARAMQSELREVRSLALQNVELTRRVERRIGEVERRIDELKDDVETIVKAEIGGRMAQTETRLEHHIHDLVDRAVGERVPTI